MVGDPYRAQVHGSWLAILAAAVKTAIRNTQPTSVLANQLIDRDHYLCL